MSATEADRAAAIHTLIEAPEEHTRGLSIRHRGIDVAVAAGSKLAVRISTKARDDVTGRDLAWNEAYVLHLSAAGTAVAATHIPQARIAALRAGQPLRWPAPSARPSTRVAAAAVRLLARSRTARIAEPVEVVARYVEDFKNQQRFTVFPRLFAAEFRHHFDFPGRGPGFESFMSVGRDLLESFSALHVHVDDLFAQGELVVESNTVRAVHRRPFAGVAATSRPVTWTEIHFYRVVEGRIVENWPAVDVERLVGTLT